MNQVIRSNAKTAIVLPAHEIEQRGFGQVIRTFKSPQGGLITEHVSLAYRLLCGDVVLSVETVAKPCFGCLAALEALEIQTSYSLEQRLWLASPCVTCSRNCAYPGCARIGCRSHMVPDPSGGSAYYCPAHYSVVVHERAIEVNGYVATQASRFFKSLFFR